MSSSIFNALHLIKVFGALMVVTCHYAGHYYQFPFYSYGTGCFFVVTGYYTLNWERSRGLYYIFKRMIRLYPAYLVAVFAYLLTKAPPGNEWATLVLHHLTFLLTVSDRATALALNPPFWSLPVFFTFFILVAFMPRIIPRGWQVIVLVVFASVMVASPLTEWREGYLELLVLPFHLTAFWLGGWIGHRAHRQVISPSSGYTWLAIALMSLAVGCGFIYQHLIEAGFWKVDYYYRGAMVLVYGALFWAVLHSHLITRPSRILVFLGTISFGVYLFHNLPLFWLDAYIEGSSALPIAVGLSVLLAWGSWKLVEAPLLRFCKPRLVRWMGAQGA